MNLKCSLPALSIYPQVLEGLDRCLVDCSCFTQDNDTLEQTLGVVSELVKHSAWPSTQDLVKLLKNIPLERLKTCFLCTVSSARNPFIPGVNLSVALAKAAKSAPEGYQRDLISLQNDMVALLREILERLPQTVRGFRDGMVGCSAMFEPVGLPGKTISIRAPLTVLLQERKVMEAFCASPLVTDFLARRFSAGLPDLWDYDGVLSDEGELKYLTGDGIGGEDRSLVFRSFIRRESFESERVDFLLNMGVRLLPLCQGAEASFPSLSILPGAQFIVAGVLAKHNNYYSVPVMRMVVDFLLYLAMLAVFSAFVLFHVDGALTSGEVFFAVLFVLVSG